MELRRRMTLAGCVVFASVMLSGRAAWAVDPCSLLTTGQAAAALGVPDVNAGAGANRCIWTPKKYKQGAGQLTILLEGANDGAKMMGQGTAVSGIGDEAIQTVVGNGAVLHVRKGNTWFVVNVHGVPPAQATQVEQTVAKEIVGKI
ncbi:MAG: hypothetical protein WCA10_22285 [Terracidiphilus sp.]